MEMCDIGGADGGCEIPSAEALSTTVVRELASELGESPVDMTPLSESIDPDALDKLFRNGDTNVTFQFEHEGATVHVSESAVSVDCD